MEDAQKTMIKKHAKVAARYCQLLGDLAEIENCRQAHLAYNCVQDELAVINTIFESVRGQGTLPLEDLAGKNVP